MEFTCSKTSYFNLLEEILFGSVISMIYNLLKTITSYFLSDLLVAWPTLKHNIMKAQVPTIPEIKLTANQLFASIGISMEYTKYPILWMDNTFFCPSLLFRINTLRREFTSNFLEYMGLV